MLAKGGLSGVLAASLVVAAAAMLLVARESAGLAAGAAASLAIIAVWNVGTAGRPKSGTPQRRNLPSQAVTVGLGLSLAAGALLAAGLADGPGFFGLPRSLWGLLLGIWLIPLALTSLGFAVSFTAPTPAELERLRARSREDP
ncbi:MAG: hypothetical protein OXH05_00420 [Acidobacteria bacterium]|nr:hypothetical protein [Acidobacteriota bacterium]